jgi:RNA-directed DNA polymerase
VVKRYFGRFHKFRNDRWVFGNPAHPRTDRGENIPHMVRFGWTNIIRHESVAGRASPDDPDLRDYWAKRRRRVKPPLDDFNVNLLARQAGRCPICGDHLLCPDQPPQSPREWERWWLGMIRQAISADHLTHQRGGGTTERNRTRLIHRSCHEHLKALRHRNRQQPAQP